MSRTRSWFAGAASHRARRSWRIAAAAAPASPRSVLTEVGARPDRTRRDARSVCARSPARPRGAGCAVAPSPASPFSLGGRHRPRRAGARFRRCGHPSRRAASGRPHALLADLVVILQARQLAHALAPHGALALPLARALDALVLGHCLDALGVDFLGAIVEVGLLCAKLGRQRRPLTLQPVSSSSRPPSCLQARPGPLCAVAMRFLLHLGRSVPLLELFVEHLLDLALRGLGLVGEMAAAS